MTFPLRLDAGMLAPDLDASLLERWKTRVLAARQEILDGTGPGSDFLGWLDPESLAPAALLDDIEACVAKLRKEAEVLVTTGIGGSYLGAKAVIEALGDREGRARVKFAGQNISARWHADLLAELDGVDFAINAISKSGTTTEPAIAFRILHEALVKSAGAEAAKSRVVVTTDPAKGALRKLADEQGLKSYVIPGNVGGRFSVLTPVGLLPIAFAGVDIRALVAGAVEAAELFRSESDPARNPALAYACYRNALYGRGLSVETMAVFEPALASLAEWWKQLYGESEGKDGFGLLPTSLLMTTDLHSLGQYVQDGRRQLFETFIEITEPPESLTVPEAGDSSDGLGYLAGRELHAINREARRGTQLAHREGGVPILTLNLERLDARTLGALLYTFEAGCAVSGTLLGVNPFDQPAVEAYKRNMFALLGKPGFEDEGRAVRERLAGYEGQG